MTHVYQPPPRSNPAYLCALSVFVALSLTVSQGSAANPRKAPSASDSAKTTAFSAAAESQAVKPSPNRLVVIRNNAISDAQIPKEADEIVKLARDQTDLGRRLREELGRPISVVPLIVERPSLDYISALSRKSSEYALLSYVVLEYENAAALGSAKKSLLGKSAFASVSEDAAVEFSSAPNDTYFAPLGQTSPLNRQWGITALNLPAAWDTQLGYA